MDSSSDLLQQKQKRRDELILSTAGDATAPDDPEAPIDLATMASRYGVHAEMLLMQFLKCAQPDLEKLQIAFDGKDRVAFMKAVHGFKGVCGAIFANKMRATCVELELSGREDWNDISTLLERLQSELNEAQAFISCQTKR